MLAFSSRKRRQRQRGAGAVGAPLSYMNTNYREPSAPAGSDIQISEPGLARPVLNPTGGKRSYSKGSYSKRGYSRRNRRKQRGSGAVGAPLSYMNTNYREPSAAAGSDIQISEPGLARPVLNPTGGKRSYSKRNRRTQRGSAFDMLAYCKELIGSPPPPLCPPPAPVPCIPPPPPPTPPPPPMPAPSVSGASCPCRGGRCRTVNRRRHGGFYPSVMGNFIGNASRLVPVAAITGYRMIKNYNKTRKNRK